MIRNRLRLKERKTQPRALIEANGERGRSQRHDAGPPTKVGEMIAHPDKKYSAVAGTSTQFIVLKDSTFGVRVPPGPLKLPDMGPNDRSGRSSLNRNSSFSQS